MLYQLQIHSLSPQADIPQKKCLSLPQHVCCTHVEEQKHRKDRLLNIVCTEVLNIDDSIAANTAKIGYDRTHFHC